MSNRLPLFSKQKYYCMKKIALVIATLSMITLALISCNKDYTCVCSLNGIETSRSSVRASSKNAAQDECNKMTSVAGVTHKCEIQ
jgi:hypothetical protein